ncbi:hypothetical protein [Rhizobium sp. BK602]|uniref:hypothetical protein n=1 Tax=Rhizobium sp. BK602 TaxID=2586986 RepID=UPI0016223D8E|nr:hypothetical protein [Rhizobium sp. BK602]MBB3608308.1 hypothetical protein [Rhizobium sp. BK602]
MSPMLSRYLKDFGAELPPPSGLPDVAFEEATSFLDAPEEPPVDIEAERRDAYAQGHEAATQELTGRHRAELEALAEAHRREIEALRSQYEEQAAEKIAAGMTEIATMLGQAVSAETADLLAPIMTEALSAGAVADLAELVASAVLEGDVGPVTVSGPRHLFDILESRLRDSDALLRHVEADDVDLTVTIGESVLVTRMSAWAASLREILK